MSIHVCCDETVPMQASIHTHLFVGAGMNKHEKAALQKLTVELCKQMNPDDMRPSLLAKKMLTYDQNERLGAMSSMREKSMFILQLVPTKGSKAFELFVESLQETSDENPTHASLAAMLLDSVADSCR